MNNEDKQMYNIEMPQINQGLKTNCNLRIRACACTTQADVEHKLLSAELSHVVEDFTLHPLSPVRSTTRFCFPRVLGLSVCVRDGFDWYRLKKAEVKSEPLHCLHV